MSRNSHERGSCQPDGSGGHDDSKRLFGPHPKSSEIIESHEAGKKAEMHQHQQMQSREKVVTVSNKLLAIFQRRVRWQMAVRISIYLKVHIFFGRGRRPGGLATWAQGRHTSTWLVALSTPRSPTLSGTVCPSPLTTGGPVWALSDKLRCGVRGSTGSGLVV